MLIVPKKVTYEYVKNYIESNSGCKLLSAEYKRAKDKMKFLCECGNEFETTYDNFKSQNKRQCDTCSISNIKVKFRKSNAQFIKEVYDIVGEEYTFLEKYINSQTKIKCKHNKCGHIWEIIPNNFLKGKRCPECNKGFLASDEPFNKKTNEEFVQEVYDLVDNEYAFLEEYVDARTKIKCRHNDCGYIWNITPDNFLRGRRCPQCAESKGEQKIREHLQNIDVVFEQEYSFIGLLSDKKNPLRFDFAIYNSKNNLKFLIEYDGIFHYEQQYDEDGFNDLKIHDKRKDQYCKDNNIPLLRIPYWEFDNIEPILNEWLSRYSLIENKITNDAI